MIHVEIRRTCLASSQAHRRSRSASWIVSEEGLIPLCCDFHGIAQRVFKRGASSDQGQSRQHTRCAASLRSSHSRMGLPESSQPADARPARKTKWPLRAPGSYYRVRNDGKGINVQCSNISLNETFLRTARKKTSCVHVPQISFASEEHAQRICRRYARTQQAPWTVAQS